MQLPSNNLPLASAGRCCKRASPEECGPRAARPDAKNGDRYFLVLVGLVGLTALVGFSALGGTEGWLATGGRRGLGGCGAFVGRIALVPLTALVGLTDRTGRFGMGDPLLDGSLREVSLQQETIPDGPKHLS